MKAPSMGDGLTPFFLNMEQVCSLTSLSPSTIDRQERAGLFPKRTKITKRRVAWLTHEIEDWVGGKK